MATKPEYDPITLSSDTIKAVPIKLKVIDGGDTFNTVALLGNVLVQIHRLRSDLITDPRNTEFPTSRITLTHGGFRDRDGNPIADPHVPGIELLNSEPSKNPHRKVTVTDATLATLWNLGNDARQIGDLLDAMIRNEVPILYGHDEYTVITAGAEKVSGYRLVAAPERTFTA